MPYAQRLAGQLAPGLLIYAGVAFGQYPSPGQYPGGYPPGIGIPGIHLPQRHPKESQDTNASTEGRSDAKLIAVSGNLRQIKDKKLLLETEANTILRFRLLDKTRYQKENGEVIRQSHFRSGDRLAVEVNPDHQETALKVIQVREGSKSERKSAEQPVEAASVRAPKETDFSKAETATEADAPAAKIEGPPPDLENDPDRPHLARTSGPDSGSPPVAGGPAPLKPVDVSATVPPPSDPHAPNFNSDEQILGDAQAVAASFTTTLPAYLAQQVTSRFFSTADRNSWQPIDEVSAELAYTAGTEKYGNFQRDGREIDRPADQSGVWSTREFRAELEEFRATGAPSEFTRRGEEKIGSRTVVVYDLTVPQSASDWVLSSPDGRRQTAAYASTVRIDKENHRVLRIEKHTTSLPHDYFFSSAKETVTYGFVSLDQHTYLLPASAENTTCVSGSGTCTRNVIEFHGYRPVTAGAQARF